jgi:hypothetical protein
MFREQQTTQGIKSRGDEGRETPGVQIRQGLSGHDSLWILNVMEGCWERGDLNWRITIVLFQF